MFSLICFAAGLLVGWFFLATPAFVKNAMQAAVTKWPALSLFIKKDSL